MELYPHQVQAVDFLVARDAAMLADDPGLGKTASAICAAVKRDLPLQIVVCPTVVALNWAREIAMWDPRGQPVEVIRSSNVKAVPDRGWIILPASLVGGEAMLSKLAHLTGYGLVVDEAHYFKTPGAKRTVALYGLGRRTDALALRAAYTWLLTGTPMPNNATELWTHLRALDVNRTKHEGRYLDWRAWRARFCNLAPSQYAPDGVRVLGNKNTPELISRMRGFSIARKKGDHLDLPPLRWGTTALDAERPAELAAIEAGLPKGASIGEWLQYLRETKQLSEWRRLCGEAKVAAAIEWLLGELAESKQQLVVMIHHAAVAERLRVELERAGHRTCSILGSTGMSARQRAVDDFQRGVARVAICNIVAGGVGITLTAASQVVFVETSWSPGEVEQAAARVHRAGQKAESVLARILYLPDSVDEIIAETLARKRAGIEELMAGLDPREGLDS